MDYQKRAIDIELNELEPLQGGILIKGPKGVGKTTTASKRARSKFNLSLENDLRIAKESPNSIFLSESPILIDEWQLAPNIWDQVKTEIDEKGHQNLSVIMTGSNPKTHAGLHSGAGRIIQLQMRPMTLSERGVTKPKISFANLLKGIFPNKTIEVDFDERQYIEEIIKSGFPGIRNLNGAAHTKTLETYLELIANHDLPAIGFKVRQPKILYSWMQAYASLVGTTASWEKIRNAATNRMDSEISRKATQPYIELLSELGILDELPAWTGSHNFSHQLAQMNKHYLADPALAVRLMKLSSANLQDSETRPYLGQLFESLAVLSVRTYSQAIGANVYHLRTSDTRHEVDLIVESDDGKITAIEIKLSGSVDENSVENLLWLHKHSKKDISNLILINSGNRAYVDQHGILILPLALLMP